MDKIIISGARFFAKHGVHDFEKTSAQCFEVDAVLHYDLSKAMESDSLGDTVSYGDAYRIIEKTVTENSFNLIERLAGEILKNLFDAFKQVDIIKVTVKKPSAPIKGEFDCVAVEIERNRND